MPEWSSPNSNSSSAQIIPFDSMPRILTFFISIIPLGIIEPMGANTTFCASLTFGAPQTTCKSDLPSYTVQTDSLSAFGWFCTSFTNPTIIPAYFLF